MIESLAGHYLSVWTPFGYAIAFVGMVVEGEVLLLVAAFLTSLGYFNPFLMAGVLLSGAIFSDVLWYQLGKYVSARSGINFPKWIHRLSHPLDRHLRDRPRWTIFVSKFVYGANHATLMRAGALGISKEAFFKSTAYANLAWVGVVGGLGYLFAASLGLLKQYVRAAEIIFLVLILMFLVGSHLLMLRGSRGENGEGPESETE